MASELRALTTPEEHARANMGTLALLMKEGILRKKDWIKWCKANAPGGVPDALALLRGRPNRVINEFVAQAAQ